MNPDKKRSLGRGLALALIIVAVLGTEISYHFTLETRFDGIEARLQQDAAALQQMQDSLDAMAASKSETLSGLNRQLATLQSSFEPLGKTSQAQADALAQLRQQIGALQQAQAGQQDAQKKLSDYLAQLEDKVKQAKEAAAKATSAPVLLPVPAPAPMPAPPTVPAATALPASTTNSVSDLMASPGAVAHGIAAAPDDAPRAQMVAPPSAAVKNGVALRNDSGQTGEMPRSMRALPVGAALGTQP